MFSGHPMQPSQLIVGLAFFISIMVPITGSAGTYSVQEPAEHTVVQEADAQHAEEEAHGPEAKPWFYWPAKWFNFVALCGLLYWVLVVPPGVIRDIFSFPGLKVILADRAASIFVARDLAVQQSEEAARVLSGSEQRLSKIDEEVATLVEEAHRDAEREKGRASEDGKRQAERIIEVTEREVNNERVGANRELRTFVADLAVNMAATNLAAQLTPDDHNELIRDYLSRLGKSMA